MVTILLDHLPCEFEPSWLYHVLASLPSGRLLVADDTAEGVIRFALFVVPNWDLARATMAAVKALDWTGAPMVIRAIPAPPCPGQCTD